jgi:hypothetical protein
MLDNELVLERGYINTVLQNLYILFVQIMLMEFHRNMSESLLMMIKLQSENKPMYLMIASVMDSTRSQAGSWSSTPYLLTRR